MGRGIGARAMNLGLDNKVVIVCGGASGIGAAVVSVLASEGAIPFILDSSLPPAELLARTGAPAQIIDFADAAACIAAVDRVASRFGRIDALVNGAHSEPDVEEAEPAFASATRNLAHCHLMTQACLPHLRRTRGSVISIANRASLELAGSASYVATKAGIVGLTREWAAQLSKDEIRVNALIPGGAAAAPFAQTDRNARFAAPPCPHPTDAGEIANAAAFLLSECAGRTTGQWLCIDGWNPPAMHNPV